MQSSKEKEALQSTLPHLPDDHVLVLPLSNVTRQKLQTINTRGIDVVISDTDNAAAEQYWECIAAFGRLVTIGSSTGVDKSQLTTKMLSKNVTIFSADVQMLAQYRPEMIPGYVQNAMLCEE